MLKAIILVSLIAIISSLSIAAIVSNKTKDQITEKEKIERLNKIYDKEIFKRSEIKPLVQFIDTYKPSDTLEFFDNATMKEVVSIASVVEIEGEYKVSFSAPVSVLKSGKYELTGEPIFMIEDLKGGKFTKVSLNGEVRSTSPSIRLNSALWKQFMEANANIETLRTTKMKP